MPVSHRLNRGDPSPGSTGASAPGSTDMGAQYTAADEPARPATLLLALGPQ